MRRFRREGFALRKVCVEVLLCGVMLMATGALLPQGVLFSQAQFMAHAQAQEKRLITEKDILKFKWIADPQISADGKQVAYVLVTVNEKDDRYETSIWMAAADGASPPRQITSGPRDSSPRWSPDGRTLAFNRAGERDPSQIYLLSLAGGEAQKWTDLPRGAGAAVWSPDGRTIAFSSTTTPEDIEQKKSGKPAPKRSDVRVITRAVYRFNGAGWSDPSRIPHIWTIAVPADWREPGEAKQITSGEFGEGGISWSSDGQRIIFTANRVKEAYYEPPDANVYSIRATGGDERVEIDIKGPVGDATPSPDKSRWAFVGYFNPAQIRSHQQAEVFVYAGGKATSLTDNYDYEIDSGLAGDQRPPRGGGGQPLVWSADGKYIYFATTRDGAGNIVRIAAAGGAVEPVTSGKHDVQAYSASADASRFAVTISTPTKLGELYLLDAASKKLTQLTRHNDELFNSLKLSEPEEFWYTSFDGKKIQAWILKPPDFDASKKYPMILQIHGGPHTAYGWTMTHEFLWMAAKGYVVLYTNPRGSTSYGQEFSNSIQYKYPGDDHKDIMAGVDEVLKRGYVDAEKLGVTGGSGGGLLTNHAVTQTSRFKAAVSQRSVADWLGFWYTADFTLFQPTWFRSVPFRDPEEFLARSPVRYADKITTPMMFVEGDADLRTPPGQGGEAMFRALKMQKKTAVMVRFPGETHDLSRNGAPQHRIERLQHIVNWFEKYLKGADMKMYDQQ